MRLKCIACEIVYRELCAAVALSPHVVDLEFLPKGLHDIGSVGMLRDLQAAVDRVDASRYDAVLLGYALCNNGVVGLRARERPLVLPRAHDCITLFMGSRRRYNDYFHANPGVYFLTSGWIERGHDASGQFLDPSIGHQLGLDKTYDELVERYGEDNAQYLRETLGDGLNNYRQFTYIDMGLDPNGRHEAEGRQLAEQRGWTFEKLTGDNHLLRRLVNGDWAADDFLVVPPGGRIEARYDESIVAAIEDGTTARAAAPRIED